jgi:hypothetical protein
VLRLSLIQLLGVHSEAGNVEVAKYAQKRALSVDPWNPEVLLQSGIYFTDAHADRMVSDTRVDLDAVKRLPANSDPRSSRP